MLRIHFQSGSALQRPRWPVLAGLVLVGLVIVVPLVLLALAVMLVGAVLFIPLALVSAVFRGLLRSLTGPLRLRPRGDGRSNVRVIPRDET